LDAHDALVVTAVGVAEVDEPEELEEAPEEELAVAVELTVTAVLALRADLTFRERDAVATVVVFAAAFVVSAGSWPVASCTKIPPVVARNVAAASATTRVRITLTRCLRARRRSATRPLAPDRAAVRCTDRRAAGEGRA
jgi:hypothetical protein